MSTALIATTPPPFVKASTQLATALGIEPAMMIETIKAQCFKNTTPDKVSDAQLASFISICSVLKLNPLVPGMVYAYPERNGGITPMVGPDGVFFLLSNNPDIVAGAGGSAWWTEHGKDGDEVTCTAFINHKTKGVMKKTVYLSEWKVGSNPNWNSRQRHMLEIRALKQCARQIMHGLPEDEDELRLRNMTNVTETAPGAGPGPAPTETIGERLKAKRGRPPKETIVEGQATDTPPATSSGVATPPEGGSATGHADAPGAPEPAPTPAAEAAPAAPAVPDPVAPAVEDAQERQRVIDATQDKMLELGVSEIKLLAYALKIKGMIPEGCKSVWDLPTEQISKLKLAVPALSVGREPKPV